MNWIRTAIRQPVSVAVGVILILLAGFLALGRIPIQLTPNVEDTIVSVQTLWEGASPEEIEQEIVDEQEDKLQGLANLVNMTSQSVQGLGRIRLEFAVGTDKDVALREVSDKLREVPEYPANADEPVVEASDPENRDYIAWIVFGTTDPGFDIRTLQDFAEDRLKPVLERVPGMSEIGVLGGREREVQIRYDPTLLAQRGVTVEELVEAIRRTNQNRSAGELPESKLDVRVRLISQYESVDEVESTVVAETDGGVVHLRDVAEVVETYKEPTSFVRSRGRPVIAINAQREVGSNVMQVMAGLRAAVDRMNAPDGVLASEARKLGLDGELGLELVYDQTVYIDDALALVQNNIWIGGGLAIVVLLLFLRSLRTAGIVALAIPISVVGAIVSMVALGRSINVISLAGMAFAVGMVVDNAIVVLENVYRHLELGKRPFDAALDGAREVFGAVLAATLTTVVVFVPILLIEEEAGQLFRDIALAIVASVTLSLVVSVTVIPCSAARILRASRKDPGERRRSRLVRLLGAPLRWLGAIPRLLGGLTYALGGSVLARVAIVALLTVASLVGTYLLLPPLDYLPQGNRNLIFGLLIPPPGYNVPQRETLAGRIEATIAPFYEAGALEPGTAEYERAKAELPEVPTFDMATMGPGPPIVPPPVSNYFSVGFENVMFHGGVASEEARAIDLIPLFQHATRAEVAPGVLGFAFQIPLFQLGGSTGSAVKINFSGDDLEQVTAAAGRIYGTMIQRYGVFTIQPDPSNFNLAGPELQVVPDRLRLSEAGMTPASLGLAVQTLGDGAIIGDYRVGGQTIDLKVLVGDAFTDAALADLGQRPIASPRGDVVPLSSLAHLRRVNAAPQINRESRQRSVTLQFTPPPGTPLESAVGDIEELLASSRAAGVIPDTVETSYTGSASKLAAVQDAMLGDDTVAGTLTSSLVLALLVVYLLLCVLFQSFLLPLIILFSVPLATLGGFAALYGVHVWSQMDRYLPVQNLDVLTMLGFVILIGVVVNNAILLVHQSLNFVRGSGDEEPLPARRAVAEAVRTRVRPIFMGALTSVGGMAPLVFMPGSGSELYRGLGSVVLGGLLVSTVFTLFLVPLLLSLVLGAKEWLEQRRADADDASGGAGGGAGERPRLGAPRAVAQSAPLACALLLLVGCAQPRGYREEPTAGRSAAAVSRRLVQIGGEEVPARRVEAPGSDVEAILAERRAELDRLGAPADLEVAPASLASDLWGDATRTVPVGLDELLRSAAVHNLGLRAARLQPEIEAESVEAADAAFDVVVYSLVDVEDRNDPLQVPFIGVPLGVAKSETDGITLEGGVRKRLRSGATVTASTFLERADNDSSGIDFIPNPAYRTGLAVSVVQPLLRDFGSEVNQGELDLARNRRDRSEHALTEELLVLLARVAQGYWDLEEAWRQLAIQERLTAEGVEVERVLSERKSFDADPAQVSDALATVEQRRANLLRARRAVQRTSDRLKGLVDDPRFAPGTELLLEPPRALEAEPLAFQLRESIELALAERPDVQGALLAIDDARLRERIASNQSLPLLDLFAEVSVAELDDSTSDALEDIVNDDFVSFAVGLSFELPPENRAADAVLRRARLEARASLLAYEAVVRDVVLEIQAVLHDVQTAWQLIEATRSFRVAQTDNLRALLAEEETRSELSPEFLELKFNRQETLARAQLEEMRAVADYRRALAAYYLALGLGPDGNRVDVQPESAGR